MKIFIKNHNGELLSFDSSNNMIAIYTDINEDDISTCYQDLKSIVLVPKDVLKPEEVQDFINEAYDGYKSLNDKRRIQESGVN